MTTNLKVNLDADATKLEQGFKRGAKSAEVFGNTIAKTELQLQRQGQTIAAATREMEADFAKRKQSIRSFQQSAGIGLLGFGTAVALGFGVAAKAASDWESAFAGVRKVVSGSDEQIAALEGQLRSLAKTLPATATEIAGVAESAGQLGVARQDIASFTSTMIALGVSTNLSADQAATGLAQLGNIMGVLPSQAGRAGAALVALGNAGASTEADILAMGLRIAGAGKQVGLSEAQVLGYANALASMGIEAESGGTAISRVFLNIQQAVINGGARLDGFAKVAGLSAAQFKTAFQNDAGGAVAKFIGGLGKMSDKGQNTVATLGKLGLSEIRVRDTLLRASSASKLLTDSLSLGSTAWEQQTALLAEASKRYETTASKIQIARNQLNDAAIDIGAAILPAFAAAAGTVGDLASAFTELPGPVKNTAAALGVAAAAVGLLSGAALVAVPKFKALLDTLDSFGGRGAKAATGLRKSIGAVSGALAGPLGIALAAGTVALGVWAAKQAEARARVKELSGALDQQTGAVTDQARALTYSKLEQQGLGEVAQKAGLNLGVVTDAALGNAAALKLVNTALDDLRDKSTRGRNVGPAAQAEVGYNKLAAAVRQSNGDLTKAQEQQKRAAEAMDTTSASAQELAASQGKVGKSAALSSTAIDDLVKSLNDLNGDTLSAREAAREYEAAIDAVTASVKKNGKSLDITTAKGRENQDALDAVAEAAEKRAATILRTTGSDEKFRASLKRSRDELVVLAEKFGLSKKKAQEYADTVLKIPPKKSTDFKTPGLDAAKKAAKSLNDYLSQIDGRSVSASVSVHFPTVPKALNDYLSGRHADGGPIFGAGTATSDSIPALLSNGEHVLSAREVQGMGGHGKVERLRAMARSGQVPAFASGGAVDLIRDFRTLFRRGSYVPDITGSLSGAYSAIDQLLEQSRNKDLSKGQRKTLADAAREAEPALRSLYAQADKIDKALGRAKDRLESLKQVRDQVSSSLQGGFSFSSAVADATRYEDTANGGVRKIVDTKVVRAEAKAYAAKLKTFAARLDTLRKLGMPASILQELVGLGAEDGIVAADAWIKAGRGEIKSLASAYKGIDKYADLAGTNITKAMYKGGVDAAQGLVDGLESKQAAIEKQMVKIAKGMEKALKEALGIHSPSRKAIDIADNFGGTLAARLGQHQRPVNAAVTSLVPRLTLSSPVGASAAAAGYGTSHTQVFHLDGAAASGMARGYAVEVQTVRRRAETAMSRG